MALTDKQREELIRTLDKVGPKIAPTIEAIGKLYNVGIKFTIDWRWVDLDESRTDTTDED